PKERLERSSPKKRRPCPLRRGLSPGHQTPLLCSRPKWARQAHFGRTALTFGPVRRARQTSPRGSRQPQQAYPAQNHREQLPRHRGFCQLEDDVLGVRHDLRSDLAPLLACRAGECPGPPTAARYFLNWWDDSPREEARRELLAEVRRERTR